jgi:arylsulfatase A-like enzyme
MKRAVYVNCDGLCTDWISPERTPTLAALSDRGLRCANHCAVFPSVTRASAASVATGCRPIRHGLHGNRMGLIEDGRLVVRDVGPPDFRGHMRKALGRTLRMPTMSQRVAKHGGFVAYSNVSPGAAYFLDPEEHGEVRHRAGSYGPGGATVPALPVKAGLDGDAAMAEQFCREALQDNPRAISVLWFGDPDLTMHNAPIGSPEHMAALKRIDGLVGQVAATIDGLRAKGQDILLLVGADHGHETVGQGVNLTAWLDEHGFGPQREAGKLAFATQGTAALLYAIDDAVSVVPNVLGKLKAQPWVDAIATGEELERLGVAPENGLVAGLSLARDPTPNAFGVAGQRWACFNSSEFKGIGYGQHGGWGPDETRPFLVLSHPDCAPARRTEQTSLIDIAPTILTFLGLPVDGIEGKAVGWR